MHEKKRKRKIERGEKTRKVGEKSNKFIQILPEECLDQLIPPHFVRHGTKAVGMGGTVHLSIGDINRGTLQAFKPGMKLA